MGKISKILLSSLFVSTESAQYSVTGCNDETLDVSKEKKIYFKKMVHETYPGSPDREYPKCLGENT